MGPLRDILRRPSPIGRSDRYSTRASVTLDRSLESSRAVVSDRRAVGHRRERRYGYDENRSLPLLLVRTQLPFNVSSRRSRYRIDYVFYCRLRFASAQNGSERRFSEPGANCRLPTLFGLVVAARAAPVSSPAISVIRGTIGVRLRYHRYRFPSSLERINHIPLYLYWRCGPVRSSIAARGRPSVVIPRWWPSRAIWLI